MHKSPVALFQGLAASGIYGCETGIYVQNDRRIEWGLALKEVSESAKLLVIQLQCISESEKVLGRPPSPVGGN